MNGDAIDAVLDGPDGLAGIHTFVRPAALKRTGRTARAPETVMEDPGVISLGLMQLEGWQYLRA